MGSPNFAMACTLATTAAAPLISPKKWCVVVIPFSLTRGQSALHHTSWCIIHRTAPTFHVTHSCSRLDWVTATTNVNERGKMDLQSHQETSVTCIINLMQCADCDGESKYMTQRKVDLWYPKQNAAFITCRMWFLSQQGQRKVGQVSLLDRQLPEASVARHYPEKQPKRRPFFSVHKWDCDE